MNKKLIVLMLLMPLLLMVSIYTSTNSSSLNVKISVNKIEITGDDIVYLNLEQDEKYLVNYAVYPVAATNKNVTFTTEQVGNDQLAILEFENGYIYPKSVGLAKVYLTTVDGGFKDSFIVKVISESLTSINASVEKDSIVVGETVSILTTFNPSDYKNQLVSYSSSDNLVATVNVNGVIRGEGRGSAIITVTSDVNNQIKDQFEITVYNRDVMDISKEEVYVWNEDDFINLSIDDVADYELTYEVFDQNGDPMDYVFDEQETKFVDLGNGKIKFEYSFNSNFFGSFIVKFKFEVDDVTITKQCLIHKVDQMQASLSYEVLSCEVGGVIPLHQYLTILPEDVPVEIVAESSNANISANVNDEKITIRGLKPGVSTVTLTIKNTISQQTIPLDIEIVVKPDMLFINEQQFSTFGIENIYTVGKYEVNEDKFDGENVSKISAVVGGGAGEDFWNNFSYETDNENVEILNDGTIKILNEEFTGIVEVVGKFEYKGVRSDTVLHDNYGQKIPFKIRCVGSGVNVRNFEHLYKATRAEKVVVLQSDVINDFGKIDGVNVFNESTVTKILSTYDTTHYKNLNSLDKAYIKILINFKNDVYGNGYVINSHNVAYGLDASDNLKSDALFRGPIDFVSVTDSASSVASVKGQDNVSFAVYENVTLNNVELKSCTLKEDNGGYDLNDLKYVGTTVEVFGDNVNINYCRLSNGRTVLRAFGYDDVNKADKVINLSVKNSVLSCAREFIVRVGSNCFVDGTKQNPSPYLDDNTSISLPLTQDVYQAMTKAQKEEYDSKYIKTFINIKNSILQDSGLFCVGIDTHFAGSALADGTNYLDGAIKSWKDLAKTSYGAKLTLEGDVRMYDWKEIGEIDSSTLIEVQKVMGGQDNMGVLSKYDLTFDIKSLLSTIAQKEHFKTIIYNKGEKQYVHGGVALFGGGKNYGVVEFKDYTFKTLNGYSIRLSDVDKSEFQVAAGNGAFYFLLNDSSTDRFKPEDQEAWLSGSAGVDPYEPIYKD